MDRNPRAPDEWPSPEHKTKAESYIGSRVWSSFAGWGTVESVAPSDRLDDAFWVTASTGHSVFEDIIGYDRDESGPKLYRPKKASRHG